MGANILHPLSWGGGTNEKNPGFFSLTVRPCALFSELSNKSVPVLTKTEKDYAKAKTILLL